MTAESWTHVYTTSTGDEIFVGDQVLKNDENEIYFWVLTNYKEPIGENLSNISHYLGDCEAFRIKSIEYTFFRGSMGEGDSYKTPEEFMNTDWVNPPKNSVFEKVLKWIITNQ